MRTEATRVQTVAGVLALSGAVLWGTVATPPGGGAEAGGVSGAARLARGARLAALTLRAALARRTAAQPATIVRGQRTAAVRIAFVGDVALTYQLAVDLQATARGLASALPGDPDTPLEHVAERLRAADLVVGNLECVVSSRGQLATDHKPLRCPAASVAVLQRTGFDLVNVGNNHAMDFGPLAFQEMLRTLRARQLAYFGAEAFHDGPQAVALRQVGSVRLGLLAFYDDPTGRPIDDVRRARTQVDVLAVYCHWGREDAAEPLDEQRRLARAFIDAGADLVVGSHAHVLQPTEWYRGSLIAYGLGNFIFPGMGDTQPHRRGALLEVDLDAAGLRASRLVKTELDRRGVPRFVGERELAMPAR